MAAKSVVLESVRKSYERNVVVLNDVSLRVEAGEFFTIIGPSGSGKTTILSLIAGLISCEEGKIKYDDLDISRLGPAERDIGLVFQDYALFPHFTVYENVAYPLKIRKYSRQKKQEEVEAMLRRVELLEHASKYPAQLSGGQQQRVALARALVFRPSVLLLDEPLGALDRKLRENLQVELKTLQKEIGVTTIMVTHDQEEALSLSDRLAILKGGGIKQIGSPRELYLRPANRFVAEFLGIANLLPNSNGGLDMIRPEFINMGAISTANDQYGVIGTVSQVVFLGDGVRYHVNVEGQREFFVKHSTSLEESNYFDVGQQVRLSWRNTAAWEIRK